MKIAENPFGPTTEQEMPTEKNSLHDNCLMFKIGSAIITPINHTYILYVDCIILHLVVSDSHVQWLYEARANTLIKIFQICLFCWEAMI